MLTKQQAMSEAKQAAIEGNTRVVVVHTFDDNTGEPGYGYAPASHVITLFPPDIRVIGDYAPDGTFSTP